MPPAGFLIGCFVCTTGGSSSEEKLVQKLTLQHGGKFSRNFDPKKVTHLIVHKVGSKKHEVIMNVYNSLELSACTLIQRNDALLQMAIQQNIWDLSLDWLISSRQG